MGRGRQEGLGLFLLKDILEDALYVRVNGGHLEGGHVLTLF